MIQDLQSQIDQIKWYHEFDFGDGLNARSFTPDAAAHRRIWRFIECQLELIDFRGKSVLDIGCWDGYWSFFAERRGASNVLAADDLTQNWSDGCGIFVARQLLNSKIEIRQDLSIYELSSLQRRFDIILCLGVYYHLLDPFLAFVQIRHCCHADSLVLIEGNLGRSGMRSDEVRFAFEHSSSPLSVFIPSSSVFRTCLKAAYLQVCSQVWIDPRVNRFRALLRNLRHYRRFDTTIIDRAFTVCIPTEGVNELHGYEPPFGLKMYDSRFQ